MKKKNGSKMFFKLLSSYMIIALVPVVLIGILTIEILFNRLFEKTKITNINMIKQTCKILDADFDSIRGACQQLGAEIDWSRIDESELAGGAYTGYELYTVQNKIKTYSSRVDILGNTGVYSKNLNLMINTDSVSSKEDYYKKYLENSMITEEDFSARLDTSTVKTQCIPISDKDNHSSVFYYAPISEDVAPYKYKFFTIINRDLILDIVKSIGIDENFHFEMINDNGESLIKSNSEKLNIPLCVYETDNGETQGENGEQLVWISSNVIGVKYLLSFNRDKIFGDRGIVVLYFLAIILLSLLICVILAYFTARKFDVPFLSMFNENKMLTDNLNIYIKSERESVVRSLLFDSKKITDKEAEKYLGEINGKYFCVGYAEIENFENLTSEFTDVKAKAWDEVSEIVTDVTTKFNAKCFENRLSDIGCAYVFVTDNTDDTVNICKDVAYNLWSEYNVVMNIGTGNVVDNVEKISDSYDNAMLAVKYAYGKRCNVVNYEEISDSEKDKAYFPIEKANLLYECIKKGEKDRIDEIFNEIYTVNLKKRNLSRNMMQRLIMKIIDVLDKVIDELFADDNEKYQQMTNACMNLMRYDNIEETLPVLETFAISMSDKIEQTDDDKDFINKITEFVEAHYMDSNLSLSMVSDYMGISYYHLSRSLKRYMGTTFVVYVTKIRLMKARQMLESNKYNIEEIALATGFTGSNTFIKVFKKYFGMTPKQYSSQLEN